MNKPSSWKIQLLAFGALMFVCGGAAVGLLNYGRHIVRTPRVLWNGDVLVVDSITGWKEITYLVSDVGYARLPEPIFLLDSASHEIPPATWKKLIWRMDNGMVTEPPTIGSRVTGMFVEFKGTRSRNAAP